MTKVANSSVYISLNKTATSTLPPILNAIELYSVLSLPQSATDQQDVDAITSVKSSYGVLRNWQGDPCAPKEYVWTGLVCDYGTTNAPPRITSLVLSSSGLTGQISLDILDLKMLNTLDLSNNSLTGSIPDFLSQLPLLKVLNLEKNNLSGSILASLLEKSKNGSLSLSLGDDPNLPVTAITATTSTEKKKSCVVIPIVASIVGVVVVVLLVGIIFWIRRGREPSVGNNVPNKQML